MALVSWITSGDLFSASVASFGSKVLEMRDFPRHAHLADVLEDEILPHAMPCTPPELVDEARPVLSAAFQELMDRLVHLHMKEHQRELKEE